MRSALLMLCSLSMACRKTTTSPPAIPRVKTTIFSGPECNLPAEPEALGPSGGHAERNADGVETGKVIVPASWFIRVFAVHDEEEQWRAAAKACLEAQR